MTPMLTDSGLYTDHYELTMAQGYWLDGQAERHACFDYFFRKAPYQGTYALFTGLSDLLASLEGLRFDEQACAHLRALGFDAGFIAFLADFRFQGQLLAPPEGEVVFAGMPVIRVEGNLVETQLIETLLLNTCNYESLIATKAARLRQAAGARQLLDFGLRRAPGLGGIQASKAAVLGGMDATSNVYAAMRYGLRSSGTQAHAWIQAHDDELSAFRHYARRYPNQCILLLDTYDTLRSGLPNAIRVAHELAASGHRLQGVRLDSGDLAYLSKATRRRLDAEGLDYVQILASNQLDEHLIRSLLAQDAPIDAFGVGTKLVTGQPDAALDGVYKLCQIDERPCLKLSENPEKIILPGRKQVYRWYDEEGHFYADGIQLAEEAPATCLYHPQDPERHVDLSGYRSEPLLRPVMEQGRRLAPIVSPQEIARYARDRLACLAPEHRRFDNPHPYKVGISAALLQLRQACIHAQRARLAL